MIMMLMDDTALLRSYARTGAEDAFAALVKRHAGLVYSAALRQLGDRQFAEDVTQAVFIALSHKAKQVSRHSTLSGWLLVATRYAATAQIRASMRRARREQEAAMQYPLDASSMAAWVVLEPHLDEALVFLSTQLAASFHQPSFVTPPNTTVRSYCGVPDSTVESKSK